VIRTFAGPAYAVASSRAHWLGTEYTAVNAHLGAAAHRGRHHLARLEGARVQRQDRPLLGPALGARGGRGIEPGASSALLRALSVPPCGIRHQLLPAAPDNLKPAVRLPERGATHDRAEERECPHVPVLGV
jgi:hypothetical protein